MIAQEQQALFEAFVASFIGSTVMHAWRGYGSAIFLEFGALTSSTRTERDESPCNPSGEMSLMIEWDWRIEGKRLILCGSSTDERHWPRALGCLIGTVVVGGALFGRLLEIDLALSSGVHVVSLMTASGDPAWTLFDRRGSGAHWMHVRHGRLCVHTI